MNAVRKFAISVMTLDLFFATQSLAKKGTYL